LVCRGVGYLASRFLKQTQVVGEMIAGVLLGPSLFGLLFPQFQKDFFPSETRTIIYVVSQVGLVLYMFIIGLEFNVGLVTKRLRSAVSVSLTGIAMPFILGCAVAYLLVTNSSDFFTGTVPVWMAMLFLGSAMAITAFPMLARIIYEHNLANTSLGTIALAAGSIDDVTAWCVLAIVVASFKAQISIALFALVGGAIYAFVTLVVFRKLLKPLGEKVEKRGFLTSTEFAFILALVMLAAGVTDGLGIYAVFGAFILGAAMPRGQLCTDLVRRIEPITTTLLLPLFFINSGLNTQIGLLNEPYLWGIALLVLVAAIGGKLGGCWLAARLSGESNKDALAIGCLMNARGLMELIALNIGLEQKIITPTLFTVMVIMAVVTTLMCSPLFNWIYRAEFGKKAFEIKTLSAKEGY
jgi:Kef-type K+ transport system membrane component KefB